MRFSSSPLQFLTTHTKMSSSSSRPPHRWPRGFSAQPMRSGNNNNDGSSFAISGDSHFRSVGDANYNARQVYGHYNFPRPPHFRPSQQRPFRPLNSKPPDYRNWEYALSQPPSRCEKFVVLSYNILADYLALNHRRELYFHIPPYVLDWEWRKRKILFELGLWSPDIMCLQEVDRFQDLEEELKLYGYSGIWKMRSGVPVDGCAIFWRSIRFKLLHEESIEYNKFGLRDNVAQICVLESRNQNCADIKSDALPQSSIGSNQVVICNIHVLYNPRRGEIKLGQVRMLLDRAHTVSKLWNDAPVVICGDFNCTPKSPLYSFISEQKLDLTGLARDQVSGQSSAEIRTQRPYTPNFRSQTPNNSTHPPMLTEEKEFCGKHSGCIPEIQNNDKPKNDVESAQLANNLHQPQSDTAFNARSREEKKTDSSLSSKEIQRESIDSCKNELSSSCDLPDEVLLPVDPGKVGDQGLTPPSTACQNDNSVVAENIHGNQSSGFTDQSIPRTLTEHSQSNLSMSRLFTATMQDKLVRDEMDEGTWVTKESVSSSISESSLDEKLENAFIHDSRSDLVPETTSVADENKPTLSESSGISSVQLIDGGAEKANPSISYQSACNVETSNVATNIDFNEDQKLFGTSLEATEEVGSFDQAYSIVLASEVNSVEYVFQSDIGHDSESVTPETDKTGQYLEKHATDPQELKSLPLRDEIQGDSVLSIDSDLAVGEKNKYDPSLWTPVEMMTASGNADCTVLEHPLKLKSTYAEVEDYSGTRDSNREPQVTSYNRRFMGTVDYIWCSEGLQTVKVLDTIPKHALQWTSGFPTKKWGSDHIALASQLAFTKGIDRS